MRITRSTGNLFTDAGFPTAEADVLALHSRLSIEIARIVQSRHLTQVRAARLFGVSQPRLNAVLRGRIERVSLDALVRMLATGGYRVQLTVTPRTRRRRVA